MTYQIDLEDAGLYFENLSGTLLEAAVRGLRLAAVRGLQTIHSVIIPSRTPQPVDRGIYRAAWRVASIVNGAEIYNDSPVAGIIEYGVRAANVKIGRALIKALAEWAIRKNIVKPAEGQSIAVAAVQMAWAIAKAARRGNGFHNQKPGGGLRILEELEKTYLKDFIVESVVHEMSR